MPRCSIVAMLAALVGLPMPSAGDPVAGGTAADAASAPARRPNIIIILTDDQGYGDLSCHGNPVLKTPHLDRLHAEAARLTDFHVSPTCSPTRSALLTGRHEFKNGVTHTIYERERLTLRATTLAQVLQKAGYQTGIFGKWHLGDEAEYRPDRRGFDEVFIHGGGGIGQTFPGSCGDAPGNKYFNPAILHNNKFEKTNGYCTDVFFAQATAWIDSVRNKGPFFVYVPTNAPHAPYIARPADAAKYKKVAPNDDVANFYGMIHNVDENVGRLLDRLKQWDLERNTLVVFMNDNGGTAGVPVFNAGMRGQKVTPFLGGTRAASFWRWPGTIKRRDITALAAHVDVFPTIAQFAGATVSDEVKVQLEGRSLVPLLLDRNNDWPDRTLFTHVGRWPKGASPETAKYRDCSVRTTRWHLVSTPKKGAAAEWSLFDIPQDLGETKNVAGEYPDAVARLATTYEDWWAASRPMMVNEQAVGPAVNPFKELYWQQYPAERPKTVKPNRQ